MQEALLGWSKSLGWSAVGVGHVDLHSCPQTLSSKEGDDPTIYRGVVGDPSHVGLEGFLTMCVEKKGVR